VLSLVPKHIRVFFRPPSWRPGHFSLLAQREVTKRKGTPAVAVAGHRARRLRECATGFADGTSVCRQRTRRDPSRRPLRGFFLRALTAAEGDPGRAKKRTRRCARYEKTSHHSARHTPSFRRRPESSISALASSFDLGARVGRRRADGQGPRERAGEREGSRSFRSRTWRSCQRNPGRPQRTGAAGVLPGLPFSLVTFSWASKRK